MTFPQEVFSLVFFVDTCVFKVDYETGVDLQK